MPTYVITKGFTEIKQAIALMRQDLKDYKANQPKKFASDFIKTVQQAILNQRFTSSMTPHSASYKQWKSRYYPATADDFWLMNGDLLFAMTYWMSASNSYKAGVDPNVTSSAPRGHNMNVSKYASWLEYGQRGRSGKQPPRPLFFPMVEAFKDDYNKRVDAIFSAFIGRWA